MTRLDKACSGQACRRLAPSCCALLLATLSACQKQTPPPPERLAPWPITSTSPLAPAQAPSPFVLEPLGHVRFSAKGKAQTPAGEFRVVRGTLAVPLNDLSGVRGEVAVDLVSLVMEGEKHVQDEWTSRARAWLGVGDSLPESTLAQQRWATFSISSIDDLSHASPQNAVSKPLSDVGLAMSGELRRVTFTAKGELSLNAHRTSAALDMEADFCYPEPRDAKAAPALILLRTRRPLGVSLSTHAIQPRSATGVLVSKDMKLLGVEVGTLARVSFELTAKPLSEKAEAVPTTAGAP